VLASNAAAKVYKTALYIYIYSKIITCNKYTLKNNNPIHKRPTTVSSNAHNKSNTRWRKCSDWV
jgi:hypothetical protein